jgi:hypothetical protein
MGEKALVESQISDGMQLVRNLDAAQFAPTFAAWYFYHEAEVWRFMIAGPAFDALLTKGAALAYRHVVDAMAGTAVSSMSIADVKLVSSDSSIPRTVGLLIATPPDALVRAHFTDNYINGIFLKEIFVLRSAALSGAPA